MACGAYLPHAISSLQRSPRLFVRRIRHQKPSFLNQTRPVSASPVKSLQWNDVLRIAEDPHGEEDGGSSDLSGYLQKVRNCNRGSEMKSEFVPFVVENQTVGYIHNGFVDHLKKYEDVFSVVLNRNGCLVTLHSSLGNPEERTKAVGDVIKHLGKLIPAIPRDIIIWDAYIFPSRTRSCSLLWHKEKDGQKCLWIGKRSDMKPTYPGLLDHLVAGGLPHGISCKENIIKECQEEAGIPRSISDSWLQSWGFIKLADNPFQTIDVLSQLEPYHTWTLMDTDGEVNSFRLVPLIHVANIIRRTEFFKPNCSLVIIDFLFRHGYISPDDRGYLELLQSLRSGS